MAQQNQGGFGMAAITEVEFLKGKSISFKKVVEQSDLNEFGSVTEIVESVKDAAEKESKAA